MCLYISVTYTWKYFVKEIDTKNTQSKSTTKYSGFSKNTSTEASEREKKEKEILNWILIEWSRILLLANLFGAGGLFT